MNESGWFTVSANARTVPIVGSIGVIQALAFWWSTFGDLRYIEPGHGGKGRKVWMHDDGDVLRMYEAYGNKKWILLWCEPTQKKTTNTQEKSNGASKVYSYSPRKQARRS